MKHTPAPWTFVDGFIEKDKKVYDFWVRDPGRQGICEIGRRNNPEAEANARLISASPELLEALKAFAKWHREYFGLDGAYDPVMTQANKAISKAEGA
jgi:hypothetical protein